MIIGLRKYVVPQRELLSRLQNERAPWLSEMDRLRLREVVDFLDFYVGSYHWHTFNIADSAITVGTFLAAIILVFKSKKNVKQSNP